KRTHWFSSRVRAAETVRRYAQNAGKLQTCAFAALFWTCCAVATPRGSAPTHPAESPAQRRTLRATGVCSAPLLPGRSRSSADFFDGLTEFLAIGLPAIVAGDDKSRLELESLGRLVLLRDQDIADDDQVGHHPKLLDVLRRGPVPVDRLQPVEHRLDLP